MVQSVDDDDIIWYLILIIWLRKREDWICQLHYLFSDILYTSKCCHGELENINSKWQQYNETNFNDLNTKMTTNEVNGYLGHGETQAENSGWLNLSI